MMIYFFQPKGVFFKILTYEVANGTVEEVWMCFIHLTLALALKG